MFRATRIFTALVIGCAVVTFANQPVLAQTAKKLKCRGCVKSKQLKNNSIKSQDIRNGAVDGSKVADGSLTAVDLGDEAGVEFVGGENALFLSLSVNTVVQSVIVTAPRSGFVIVNASGTFNMFAGAAVQCSLTTGSVLENDRQFSSNPGNTRTEFFGMTEGFVVPAGTTTFNLVCREDQENVAIVNSDMTAIYVPTRY